MRYIKYLVRLTLFVSIISPLNTIEIGEKLGEGAGRDTVFKEGKEKYFSPLIL
jgi:hypothetical protein